MNLNHNLYLFAQAFAMLLLTTISYDANAQKQPVKYVNNYIGTGSEGNTYPGAQAPFGMISVSPSTNFADYDNAMARSGYKYTQPDIRGFGLTHFSGVGCHAMQDLLLMPVQGELDVSPVNNRDAYKSSFSHADEKCSPGLYQAKLNDYNIGIKFTATQRSSIGLINFNGNQIPSVLFEPTNSANNISAGRLHIDAKHSRISGYITTGGFCWRDPALLPYTIYFVAEFDKPLLRHGFWKGNDKQAEGDSISGRNIAAYFTFAADAKKVHIKTAISFVSVENAILNMNREIPNWNLEQTYQQTLISWKKYLNKITVNGGTEDQKTIFYTAVYHNLLQPNVFDDVNGEYSGFDFKTHQVVQGHHKYVNFSMWDTYRTTANLQAILAPAEASDMVQSLLLDAQQGGAFPNWSMNNEEYGVMNGYSAFPFIANLYAFGARNFDLQAVKEMMKKVSMNYYGCQGRHGWLNIEDYKKLGYVPVDKNGFGVSMTEEYGVDDYAIAKICMAAGDQASAKYYLNRSQNVFNLYNPTSGYIQGKNANGDFIANVTDTTSKGYNEGNAIQYLWSVPHSISKLIIKAGGKKQMENRLDHFMSRIEIGWAPDKPYFWMGNEPCFGAAFVYNYLQTPWKTQYQVHRMANNYYKNTIDGLPGDDDVGAMSALYVFCAIGVYPYLPAEGGFTLSGPIFNQVTINLDHHKKIIVRAAGAGLKNPYIKSLLINGKATTKLWINWSDLNKGATLNFNMSASANKNWGASLADVPPSY